MASFLSRLSSRDRRALVLGTLIAAGALFIAFGIKPYARELRETNDDLRQQRELLVRERAALSAAERYQGILTSLLTGIEQESRPLFGGSDDISATSDLSDDVSRAAISNRVLIQQIETRKAEPDENGLVALSLDLRGEGDFEGILKFLNTLEGGEKLVRASRLALEPQQPGGGAEQAGAMTLSGTFTGYYLNESAAVADSLPSRANVP
ncbi:MAG TPA: GspMb/PilO family protein [Gemmatimonadaceae bacterium]|nr:GspMb/PilO family protein [Gemmatimonadaceae bacterium]